MDMKGEYRIPADRQRVWEMLNDPEVLRAAIPGCESLEISGEDAFSAKVTTKIGPVKATFTGEVTLSNINPPEGYTITGEGKGGPAGFASGGADIQLAEEGPETILTYSAQAKVGGKLAQLGSRLIDSTSRKLADQFFTKFAELAGAPGDPAEGAIAGAVHAAEEVAHEVSEVAHHAEEELEKQAATGLLGGPMMWGLLVILAIIVLIMIAT